MVTKGGWILNRDDGEGVPREDDEGSSASSDGVLDSATGVGKKSRGGLGETTTWVMMQMARCHCRGDGQT